MNKKMKEQVKDGLRYQHTKYLMKIKSKLEMWDHNHDLKKASWFWSDNGNASSREYKEKMYTFSESARIGGITFEYWSDCRMSRANVYWRDGICAYEHDDIHVTFGDIRYIINTIDEIITKRNERKEKAS